LAAAVVFKHGNEWRTCRSHPVTGLMEVFDAELWGIGLPLGETVKERPILPQHGVELVAVFHGPEATIR